MSDDGYSDGHDNGAYTLIDAEDRHLLEEQNWYVVAPARVGVGGRAHMHREIAEKMLRRSLARGEVVDHVNGNGLDNRRENLRIVTTAQNLRNRRKNRSRSSSRYKGVGHITDRTDRWWARIQIDLKTISLGYFLKEESAARAYDAVALAAWGEYAWLNFPGETSVYPSPGEAIQAARKAAGLETSPARMSAVNCMQCGKQFFMRNHLIRREIKRKSGVCCSRSCLYKTKRRGPISGFYSDALSMESSD